MANTWMNITITVAMPILITNTMTMPMAMHESAGNDQGQDHVRVCPQRLVNQMLQRMANAMAHAKKTRMPSALQYPRVQKNT